MYSVLLYLFTLPLPPVAMTKARVICIQRSDGEHFWLLSHLWRREIPLRPIIFSWTELPDAGEYSGSEETSAQVCSLDICQHICPVSCPWRWPVPSGPRSGSPGGACAPAQPSLGLVFACVFSDGCGPQPLPRNVCSPSLTESHRNSVYPNVLQFLSCPIFFLVSFVPMSSLSMIFPSLLIRRVHNVEALTPWHLHVTSDSTVTTTLNFHVHCLPRPGAFYFTICLVFTPSLEFPDESWYLT